MNIPEPRDDETAELLERALAAESANVEVDPTALLQIQRRTSSRSSSRTPWLAGALGAAVATAAVITAVVVVGDDASTSPGHRPADRPSGGVQQGGMHEGVYDPNADASSQVTVWYLGRASGPSSFRVFSERHTVRGYDGSQLAAVHELLTSRPIDPDYANPWPEGLDVAAVSAAESTGVTTVALTSDDSDAMVYDPAAPAESYPLGLQSMARTLGLAAGERLALTFNGETSGHGLQREPLPVAVRPDDSVRAYIGIDNIVEGQTVADPVTVTVSGNVFEGTVNWRLLDSQGTKLDDGFVTTSMGTWKRADIELGDLPAGSYTFTALEYSAADGRPINVDDKTFTVG